MSKNRSRRYSIIVLLTIVLVPGTIVAKYLSKVPNAQRLQSTKVQDRKVLGSWDINITNSLIRLHDIFYDQKVKDGEANSTIEIGRVIADYLYYKDHKDELYYSLKINDLFYIYDMGEPKETEKSEENKWLSLNLPIDNVFKEILVKNIEAIIINSGNQIPLSLDRLEMENFVVFPKKDSDYEYADFKTEGFLFDGALTASGVANPFASPMLFSLNAKIKGLSLESLNPWLKQSANLDVEKGTVDIIVEFATKKDKISGYVKFFTEDVSLFNEWKDEAGFFTNLKEAAVDFGINIMERTDEDIVSGKIKFEGQKGSIDIDFSDFFSSLVEHFFDGPLKRKYEKSIKLKNL